MVARRGGHDPEVSGSIPDTAIVPVFGLSIQTFQVLRRHSRNRVSFLLLTFISAIVYDIMYKNIQIGRELAVEKQGNEKEKCFVIMPISDQGDYPSEHFTKVYEQIFCPAIVEAGYEPYRVDEDKICTSIIGKIFSAVQDCPMAICDLSNRNPNVLYELGLRQAYDKPVVLVQDEKTERIFDVSGINTVTYNSNRLYENVVDDRKKITEAIKATRDGKTNSVIKIIKAEGAQFSSENMSKEDKLEILLSSIMNELESLKAEKRREESLFIDRYSCGFEKNVVIEIQLKSGVSNKEIESCIRKIENFRIAVSSERIRNRLIVTLSLRARVPINICIEELSKLGYCNIMNLSNS